MPKYDCTLKLPCSAKPRIHDPQKKPRDQAPPTLTISLTNDILFITEKFEWQQEFVNGPLAPLLGMKRIAIECGHIMTCSVFMNRLKLLPDLRGLFLVLRYNPWCKAEFVQRSVLRWLHTAQTEHGLGVPKCMWVEGREELLQIR